MGRLRGMLRPLLAHHRHHRHVPGSRYGPAPGEDAVHRAGRRHCAAGELRRRPGVVDAPRLEVDVVVLQPREHLDGQGPALPFELPGPVIDKLRFIHRVVRDTARATISDPSTTRAAMADDLILTRRYGATLVVTLNRPKSRNALNSVSSSGYSGPSQPPEATTKSPSLS